MVAVPGVPVESSASVDAGAAPDHDANDDQHNPGQGHEAAGQEHRSAGVGDAAQGDGHDRADPEQDAPVMISHSRL